MTHASSRLAGFFALGFVLLTLLAAFVPHEALPEDQPPADEVRAFFERNASMQAMQPLSKLVAAFLFLGFAAILAAALRDAGAPLAASVVLMGGALFAIALVTIMLLIASVVTLAPALDGATVFAIYHVAWIANVRAGIAAVPMLVAFGVGVVRTRSLPKWTGWAAFVAAAIALAGGGASTVLPGPSGIGPAFIGFLAILAWTLATGFVLVVYRPPTLAATSAPVATRERT